MPTARKRETKRAKEADGRRGDKLIVRAGLLEMNKSDNDDARDIRIVPNTVAMMIDVGGLETGDQAGTSEVLCARYLFGRIAFRGSASRSHLSNDSSGLSGGHAL
jgi:hypothetical protein